MKATVTITLNESFFEDVGYLPDEIERVIENGMSWIPMFLELDYTIDKIELEDGNYHAVRTLHVVE